MSKFVTYPAVTVLDNDHSLLIDSPSAGTNSITAENAGNTLLSKWAGFETFDEAVQNTISNNQEFIGRDTAIREETAELKKKIVTTFPAKEASGAVATFESEFEDAPLKSCIVQIEPVQDLHGQENPYPAGGGKNLLPAGAAGTFTANNGMTVVSDGKGNYRFYGTSTANISVIVAIDEVTLPDTVFMHMLNASASGQCALVLAYGETQLATPSMATVNRIIDVSAGAGGKTINRLRFYINTGYTVDITLSPMLCVDATVRSFSPYSNICPITGWTGCEVHRTGKNLLDLSNLRKGIFEGATNNTNVSFDEYQPIKGGQTYVWSSLLSFISGRYIKFYDVNKTELSEINLYGTGAKTFSAPSNARYFRCMWYASAGIEPSDIVADQIELGSTPTAYEPYTGRTYPITFPSEAGTVYGGHIDPINGELVVDRAMADLGTLNWVYNSGQLSMVSTSLGSNVGDGQNIKCSIYKVAPNLQGGVLSNNDKCIAFNKASTTATGNFTPGVLVVKDTAYSDATSFKAAMSGVQLCYELATPITIDLTAQQMTTLLGTNNIWADTGDVSVEYLMSDVSWYVEKKLRAFQSILAGVEDSTSASKNYSANTYLIFNDDIYKTTKAITAGETIEEGVNVTKTTVAEQLLALAQA